MWIYVQDYGKKFIWEALCRYLSDSPALLGMMVVYVALVVGFAVKGTKQERAWFVWPGVVWLLTVFNPLVAIPFIKMFSVDVRYYRYFWLLPLPFLLGYILVKLLDRCNKVGKALVIAAVVGLCIAGNGYMLKHSGVPDNIYKVNQYIVDMAEYIHNDSEKEENVVLYDVAFFCEMRAYDASMMPYISRYELETVGDELASEESVEAAVSARDFHSLIKYEYFGEYDLPQELMEEALRAEALDYMILSKDRTKQYQDFVAYGCVEVAETEEYWLLRCP